MPVHEHWIVWQGPSGRHVDGPGFPWMKRTAVVPVAEVERLRKALEAAGRNDKTCYDYHGRHFTNRNGERPDTGRWLTPREIAEEALRS